MLVIPDFTHRGYQCTDRDRIDLIHESLSKMAASINELNEKVEDLHEHDLLEDAPKRRGRPPKPKEEDNA